MLFKKKHEDSRFFVEDPVEQRFDAMMDLVKDLSSKDYKKLLQAMDLGYKAYQKVRGIDDTNEEPETLNYMLNDKEDK